MRRQEPVSYDDYALEDAARREDQARDDAEYSHALTCGHTPSHQGGDATRMMQTAVPRTRPAKLAATCGREGVATTDRTNQEAEYEGMLAQTILRTEPMSAWEREQFPEWTSPEPEARVDDKEDRERRRR